MFRLVSWNRVFARLGLACLAALASLAPCSLCIAQPGGAAPSPAIAIASPAAGARAGGGINVSDIKIQMAEVSYKLSSSDRNVNALISALEEYLKANCFGSLLADLAYQGPPANPECILRMEQLLAINPDNPAAACLKDGIDAQSCVSGYKPQKVVKYYDSNSLLADLPEPSLKVGLSAADAARVRVQREMLQDINQKYQNAASDDEKGKLINDAVGIYDQLLATACKVSTLRVKKTEQQASPKQDSPRAAEARQKLLKIPAHMRPDYQNQMRAQVEEELAVYKGDERGKRELLEALAVIDSPEAPRVVALKNLQRSRIVLQSCFDALEQSHAFIPLFPGSACYGHGFQTPQCISAMREWRQEKARQKRAAKQKPGAKPTPENIISSF